MVLMLAPNEVANKMMKTGDFDDEQFWLIVDPDPSMKYLAVTGLLAVDLGYVWILLSTVCWRRESFNMTDTLELRLKRWLHIDLGAKTWYSAGGHKLILAINTWKELTAMTGLYRKYWVRSLVVR